jgi:signal transduction histidine kinase
MSHAELDQTLASTEASSPPEKNILIVDDNASMRRLLRDVLQAEGYQTSEAEDGQEGLFALKQLVKPLDIIICDVLMPNMDGYSFCCEVRRQPEFDDVFFILYSVTDFTPDDEKMGLALGADKFISKQDSIKRILKTIDELDGVKRQQPERVGPKLRIEVEAPQPEAAMKKYNARLVQQLEENTIELEQARVDLRRLNHELEERVKQRTTQLEIFNGQLEQWVSDRTDQLAEQNAILETRTKELARSNGDLEQFAYAASHDLQEPLRAVSGCIQLFARKYHAGTLGEGGDQLVKMIGDGASRMKELIDALLAYSRAGQAEKIGDINTAEVLGRVLNNLEVAIEESKAEISAGELPCLRFDEQQLGQVLQNLLSNAIKYRGTAAPRIELKAERAPDAWLFSVTDNGIGFESKYLEQIFGVFQRLQSRDQYAGTGIGLAIVKRIIEHRGGRVWAQSEPDQGSTFFFSVPDDLLEIAV